MVLYVPQVQQWIGLVNRNVTDGAIVVHLQVTNDARLADCVQTYQHD